MAAWQEELNRALASGLEIDDIEEDFFLQMIAKVSDELENEGFLYFKLM